MRFLKLVIQTLLSQSFAAAALFIVGVITARLLGAADRGIYALFFTSASVISMFLYLGMTQANVYFLNQAGVESKRIISNSLVFIALQAILLGLLVLLFAHHQPAINDSYISDDLLLLLFIASILTLVDTLLSGVALGLQRYAVFVQNLVIQAMMILLVTLPLFIIELTVTQVILLRVSGSAIAALVLVARLLSVSDYQLVPASPPLLLRQLTFGVRNYAQNLLGLLSYRIYFFLLAFYTDELTVGIFSVAVLLLEAVRLIPEAVGTILFPELAKTPKAVMADLMTARVTRTVLAISLLATIGVLLLASPVVLIIFGEEYRDAIVPLRIMATGIAVGVLYQILSRYFTSRFQQHKTILSALAALLAGVFLSLLLIPELGILGAAVAFAVANFVAGFAMAIFYRRTTNLPYTAFLIPSAEDLAVARSWSPSWLARPRSDD